MSNDVLSRRISGGGPVRGTRSKRKLEEVQMIAKIQLPSYGSERHRSRLRDKSD